MSDDRIEQVLLSLSQFYWRSQPKMAEIASAFLKNGQSGNQLES
jgi:hypothetical protein